MCFKRGIKPSHVAAHHFLATVVVCSVHAEHAHAHVHGRRGQGAHIEARRRDCGRSEVAERLGRVDVVLGPSDGARGRRCERSRHT